MLHRTILTLLAALLLAGVAQAQKLSVAIEPFLGAVRCGSWQPLRVVVSSPRSAAPVRGELRLTLRNLQNHSSYPPCVWARPLTLEPGSLRRESFTIYVVSGIFLQFEVEIRDGVGDAARVREKVTFDNLPLHPENRRTILSLSADPHALDDLDGKGFHVSKETSEVRVQVCSISPAELPTDAWSLEGIWAIYCDDSTLLTEAQEALLSRFAEQGGIVIRSSTLTPWLRREMAAQRGSDKLSLAWHALLTQVPRRAVRRLAWYSTPYSWPHSTESDTMGVRKLSRALMVGSDFNPPSAALLFLFLGAYLVVLVPLQYAVLKRLDRREWAWLVTPALAVLFAVGAYVVARQGRSKEDYVNAVTLIEADGGARRGAALTHLGAFATSSSSVSLGVAAEGPVSVWPWYFDLSSAVMEQSTQERASVRLHVPMWAMGRVAARAEVDLGGGVAIQQLDRVRVRITNNTPWTLHNAVFTSTEGGHVSIGTIAPGQTVTEKLTYSKNSLVWSRATAGPEGQMESALMLCLAQERPQKPDKALLSAWVDAPPLQIERDGRPVTPRYQANLLLVHAK